MPKTETQTLDGFVIRAKCAGDYTTQGYVLEVDFEKHDQARDWIWRVLHEGEDDEPEPGVRNGKWLVLEDGGALNLNAVAVLQIVPGKIVREVEMAAVVRRRGRRPVEEDDGA